MPGRGQAEGLPPEPVRWGVLGTARVARARVLPALRRSAHAQVVAVASRDGGRAGAIAHEHGIERAYGSYEELLADRDVEAIYNPLPNHLHVPWSVRAADAGKHVLCEKPVALSAHEARELLAARDRNGIVVAEAFMVRVHPQWLLVRDLVRGGRVGELRHFSCHFSYSLADPENIRSRREWGGGALMDIGCYAVMLARWLFGGEPRRVLALLERDPVLGTDRLSSGLLEFGGGQATFTCATQLVPYQRVNVFGTHGRIEVEVPFNTPADRPCRIVIDDGADVTGGGAETVELPAADQFALQADAFSRAVRRLGEVPMTLEDSIANMAVLDALFRSAETGEWAPAVSGGTAVSSPR